MHFLRLFVPKGLIGWALLAISLVSFGVTLAPKFINPKGLLLLLVVAVPLCCCWFALPVSWIERWESIPLLLRSIVFAICAYTIVVTLGNFGELYRFRLWYEFLVPGKASPVTPTHQIGFMFGLYAFAAQFYHKPGSSPQDSERVLPGQPYLISFEEAQNKANELTKT